MSSSAFLVRVSRFELEAVCAMRNCFRPIIVIQEASSSFWKSKRKSRTELMFFPAFWSECRDSNSKQYALCATAFGHVIVIQEASSSLSACEIKKQKKLMFPLLFWSECRDSNSRPLEPHSSAIPNFATPGYFVAVF